MLETLVLGALLAILFLASFCDVRTGKVPNWLFAIGMLDGVLVNIKTPAKLAFYLIGCIVIFFIGTLRIMGMGDLKMWMVITMFLGNLLSVYCIGIAAGLLVLYAFLEKNAEAKMITKHVGFYAMQKKSAPVLKQTSYSFVPFMLFSVMTVIPIRGFLL